MASRNTFSKWFAAALLASAFCTVPVFAHDDGIEEEFVITGSKIARTDVTSENPVTIFSGENLCGGHDFGCRTQRWLRSRHHCGEYAGTNEIYVLGVGYPSPSRYYQTGSRIARPGNPGNIRVYSREELQFAQAGGGTAMAEPVCR